MRKTPVWAFLILIAAGGQTQALAEVGALCVAIEKGSIEKATELLDLGVPASWPCGAQEPGVTYPTQAPALLFAAQLGREELVTLLLRRGADLCAFDHKGEWALDRAVAGGHAGVVKFLLAEAAVTRAACADPGRSLRLAAQYGFVPMAKELLAVGVDPNSAAADDGRTPLMLAAAFGHLDVAAFLLERGADPNRYSGVETPLSLARGAAKNSERMVLLLKSQGATEQGVTERAGSVRAWCAGLGYPATAPKIDAVGDRDKAVADFLDCYCPDGTGAGGAEIIAAPARPGLLIEEVEPGALEFALRVVIDEQIASIRVPLELRPQLRIRAWRWTGRQPGVFITAQARTEANRRPKYSCGFELMSGRVTTVLNSQACRVIRGGGGLIHTRPFDVFDDFGGRPAVVFHRSRPGAQDFKELSVFSEDAVAWRKLSAGCVSGGAAP